MAPVLFVLVMVVHVTMLDFAAPRFIAPFDGDGHHCVAGYLLHDEPWRRVFGACVAWQRCSRQCCVTSAALQPTYCRNVACHSG